MPAVGKQGIIVGFYGGAQRTPLIPKARPIGAERHLSSGHLLPLPHLLQLFFMISLLPALLSAG